MDQLQAHEAPERERFRELAPDPPRPRDLAAERAATRGIALQPLDGWAAARLHGAQATRRAGCGDEAWLSSDGNDGTLGFVS